MRKRAEKPLSATAVCSYLWVNAQSCGCAGLWGLRGWVYVLVLAQHLPDLAKEAVFGAARSTRCSTIKVTLPAGKVYSSALYYTGTGKEQILRGTVPGGVQEDITCPCASGLFFSLPPSNLVQLWSHPSHHPPFQHLALVAVSAGTPRGDAAYARRSCFFIFVFIFILNVYV